MLVTFLNPPWSSHSFSPWSPHHLPKRLPHNSLFNSITLPYAIYKGLNLLTICFSIHVNRKIKVDNDGDLLNVNAPGQNVSGDEDLLQSISESVQHLLDFNIDLNTTLIIFTLPYSDNYKANKKYKKKLKISV